MVDFSLKQAYQLSVQHVFSGDNIYNAMYALNADPKFNKFYGEMNYELADKILRRFAGVGIKDRTLVPYASSIIGIPEGKPPIETDIEQQKANLYQEKLIDNIITL